MAKPTENDIGRLVTCPEGNGTLKLLCMGYAWVDTPDGEWSGPQREVSVIPENMVEIALDDPPPGIGVDIGGWTSVDTSVEEDPERFDGMS